MTEFPTMKTTFLKKKDLAARYGGVTIKTVERMVADGRLPKPDIYNAVSPLWSEASLEKHERRNLVERRTGMRGTEGRGAR
jgi:hypothetical protein